MAKVDLLQPTDMSLPTTSEGTSASASNSEVDVETNNGVNFSMLGSFQLDETSAVGTVSRALIDVPDPGNFPNLDITLSFTSSTDYLNRIRTNPAQFLADMLSGDDTILGSSGADVIRGFAGNDTMSGGPGNDTYFVENPGDQIFENAGEGTDTIVAGFNFTLPVNFEVLALNGSALNAIGNSAGNFIYGNVLDNSLDGAGGADVMFGRAGNDTYFVEDAGDQVIENAGEGTDTVVSEINYALGANVEVLALSRFAVIGTGNGLDNLLFGNDQDNLLDGTGGADDMRGRAGNDTYAVDNIGDRITENPNEGTDEVISSVNYVMGANVEKLQLAGSAVTANGNEGDNMIRGNALANIINGGSGSDTLTGGGGRDTFVFRLDAGGQDTVTDLDLTVNSDFLAFGTTLYANSADVLAHSAQVGADVVITHDPAHVITLQNTALATFTAHSGDFQFI